MLRKCGRRIVRQRCSICGHRAYWERPYSGELCVCSQRRWTALATRRCDERWLACVGDGRHICRGVGL